MSFVDCVLIFYLILSILSFGESFTRDAQLTAHARRVDGSVVKLCPNDISDNNTLIFYCRATGHVCRWTLEPFIMTTSPVSLSDQNPGDSVRRPPLTVFLMGKRMQSSAYVYESLLHVPTNALDLSSLPLQVVCEADGEKQDMNSIMELVADTPKVQNASIFGKKVCVDWSAANLNNIESILLILKVLNSSDEETYFLGKEDREVCIITNLELGPCNLVVIAVAIDSCGEKHSSDPYTSCKNIPSTSIISKPDSTRSPKSIPALSVQSSESTPALSAQLTPTLSPVVFPMLDVTESRTDKSRGVIAGLGAVVAVLALLVGVLGSILATLILYKKRAFTFTGGTAETKEEILLKEPCTSAT